MTTWKNIHPHTCGSYNTAALILKSFFLSQEEEAEEMHSVLMRIGQSATWLNWLRILCQRCNEVLFLLSHILHTAELSLQNFTEIRDEQPSHFRVVWQNSQKLIAQRHHPYHPYPSCFLFSFFDNVWVILDRCSAHMCVGALFPAVITVLEIYELSVYFITFWPSVVVIGEVCWEMKL